MKQKVLSIFVLLCLTAVMAQATENSIVINGTPQVGDNSISLTYYFDPGNVPGISGYAPTLKVKCVTDNKWDEQWLSLHDISSGTTTITLVELVEFQAGKAYDICFAYYNGSWVDEVFQSFSFPTVNITANEGASGEYWSTYYNATQGYTADENTKVFQVALSGDQLTMTEVANREIPAGKAVILKSTAASTITLTPAPTTATLDGNALQGTATAITNPGNAYVLNKKDGVVGFYKLSSTGTIGANKAYLTYSGGAGAREFFPIEGNVTGIEMPKAATTNSDAEVYDLQGRQVANPTKGLYIVNGKKVFINK